MAKKTTETPKEGTDNSRRASEYLKQFETWKQELKRFWPEMDKWQEMYEFYKSKSEKSETDHDISLNTPFAIVESQIAKENQALLNITVKAKPDGDVGKFDTWVESILYDAINDPDVAEIHGSFRKSKEKFSRALKVVGNAAAEINYCYKTQIIDGEKVVIADNPYVRTRSFKSVIFNPAMQFTNSDIYYVEDHLSMTDLKNNEQKDGKGLYTNISEVSLKLKESKIGGNDFIDDTEVSYTSGDVKIQRKNKPIRVVTRWEGTKMTVFAVTGVDSCVIIREANDPLKLGGHNLLLGMRYIVEGRPYAYGEIAAIYKPVRAQDTIVSQGIEIVNRFLRGSYILGDDVNIDQFMLVLANGGAMYGNAQSVANVPVNPIPGQAFQTVDVLQQAIERAARFSLYGAGLTAQASDQTKGTASGIKSIQTAAEPNVETQLQDVEEFFMQPVARKFLKMIARLMGSDEVRYGLLQGENKTFVKASKNILLGKATLKDMQTVGLLSDKDYIEYTTTLVPAVDQATGQPVIDPATGQPQMQQVPIQGIETALVFDVDWIVEARLDNQTAADKDKKVQAELGYIEFGLKYGVPIDIEKAWVQLGKKSGYDQIDDLLLSPEEQQKKAQAQQMAQMQQGAPVTHNAPTPQPSMPGMA